MPLLRYRCVTLRVEAPEVGSVRLTAQACAITTPAGAFNADTGLPIAFELLPPAHPVNKVKAPIHTHTQRRYWWRFSVAAKPYLELCQSYYSKPHASANLGPMPPGRCRSHLGDA